MIAIYTLGTGVGHLRPNVRGIQRKIGVNCGKMQVSSVGVPPPSPPW